MLHIYRLHRWPLATPVQASAGERAMRSAGERAMQIVGATGARGALDVACTEDPKTMSRWRRGSADSLISSFSLFFSISY